MTQVPRRWIVTRVADIGTGVAERAVTDAGGRIVDRANNRGLLIEASAMTVAQLRRALPDALITPERLI